MKDLDEQYLLDLIETMAVAVERFDHHFAKAQSRNVVVRSYKRAVACVERCRAEVCRQMSEAKRDAA